MLSLTEIEAQMNNIEYGYIKNGIAVSDVSDMDQYYHLQSPKETLQHKIGVCWDQVELERQLFAGYDFKTYFMVYYQEGINPTHTFLVFNKGNKYYWFEHSWKAYAGIHQYNDIKDLLKDIAQKHLNTINVKNFNPLNMCIYEYKKPRYGLNVREFFNTVKREF